MMGHERSSAGSESSAQQGGVTVVSVTVEHLRTALGIGTPQPRLSWMVETAAQGWAQTAYEVATCTPEGDPIEHTGPIASAQSVLVAWPFAPLAARDRRTLRIRVWGNDGTSSPWSAPHALEVGLLDPADWSAHVVTPAWTNDPNRSTPCPLLRYAFTVDATVAQARLYITALGVYDAYLNGVRLGDDTLNPGWTSYNHRLRYQTIDVTTQVHEGANVLGAVVADGWYRGRLGFGGGRRGVYGDRLALLAQLEIVYADGRTQRIVTDDRWRAATGPTLSSDLYDGETYDARLERPGWSTAAYAADDWAGVQVLDRDLTTLVAPVGPPVRPIETVAPVSVTTSPTGRTIVDFGQNLVGRLRLTVSGPAGQTITLRHAEVLENGDLSTRPLRTAQATDRYTLRGEGQESWEPRFTFHGFRYVELEGWPGDLHPEALHAIVYHSDLERIGWFDCSDPLLNRFHENVVWSMRGNFLDLPTDCPQRDERLGWTGDIQVFAPTACFLYDSAGFLSSWLQDLAAEQRQAGGAVPHFVPYLMSDEQPRGAAAWGDAAVIVPWVLYQYYGDAQILAAQFESMRSWVDYMAEHAGSSYLWDQDFQFGDWLDPSAPPDNPAAARTDAALVATAYFAHSAALVARAAGVLQRTDEEQHYLALARRVRDAFNDEFVSPVGRVSSDAATAYALVLAFDLLRTPQQRQRAGARLVALAQEGGYRVSTGFVGTPLICAALCSVGAHETAYRLLMQRACPSWLYPVTMGATTIWERWDSLLPDGSVNPGEMTSFNHYALGAIADWMQRTVAGLAPAAPGYGRLAIQPQPGGGLTHARARHHTPYGLAEVAWRLAGGAITIEVIVPPNTTAQVVLPGRDGEPLEVGSGTYSWSYPFATRVYPPLSLESTLGALIDDQEAWQAAVAALPALARFESGPIWRNTMTLHELLAWVPDGDTAGATLMTALSIRSQ